MEAGRGGLHRYVGHQGDATQITEAEVHVSSISMVQDIMKVEDIDHVEHTSVISLFSPNVTNRCAMRSETA